jgi:hypothetical protein
MAETTTIMIRQRRSEIVGAGDGDVVEGVSSEVGEETGGVIGRRQDTSKWGICRRMFCTEDRAGRERGILTE